MGFRVRIRVALNPKPSVFAQGSAKQCVMTDAELKAWLKGPQPPAVEAAEPSGGPGAAAGRRVAIKNQKLSTLQVRLPFII